MVSLEVPASYGWVVLVLVAKVVLNIWMGIQVGAARRKYKVPYPTMYANESDNKDAKLFNCVQRGHQNCLEFIPVFFVLLLLGGLQHPKIASGLGVLYLVGRYYYFIGYSTGDPQNRFAWGKYYFGGLLGLLLCTISFGVHLLYNSKT
ncbi:hypothetical protein O6H91_11G104600 [Diphasiastrum complanatum]|uniref:Uncharacterized protein n=1 Tax=Diphasiastrum complanatum TaxID=34168 RepID=A0ACC2CCB7_DIPCM|nr:hypothetical protein O6H91_11G104600 [Diphasiastrum complanatum]